jgi:hypothetical protein
MLLDRGYRSEEFVEISFLFHQRNVVTDLQVVMPSAVSAASGDREAMTVVQTSEDLSLHVWSQRPSSLSKPDDDDDKSSFVLATSHCAGPDICTCLTTTCDTASSSDDDRDVNDCQYVVAGTKGFSPEACKLIVMKASGGNNYELISTRNKIATVSISGVACLGKFAVVGENKEGFYFLFFPLSAVSMDGSCSLYSLPDLQLLKNIKTGDDILQLKTSGPLTAVAAFKIKSDDCKLFSIVISQQQDLPGNSRRRSVVHIVDVSLLKSTLTSTTRTDGSASDHRHCQGVDSYKQIKRKFVFQFKSLIKNKKEI